MSTLCIGSPDDGSEFWKNIIKQLGEFASKIVDLKFDCGTNLDFDLEFRDDFADQIATCFDVKIIANSDFFKKVFGITEYAARFYAENAANSEIYAILEKIHQERSKYSEELFAFSLFENSKWEDLEERYEAQIPEDLLFLFWGGALYIIYHEMAHSKYAPEPSVETECNCDNDASNEIAKLIESAKAKGDIDAAKYIMLGASVAQISISAITLGFRINRDDFKNGLHPTCYDRIRNSITILRPHCNDDWFALLLIAICIFYNIDANSVLKDESTFYDALITLIDAIDGQSPGGAE